MVLVAVAPAAVAPAAVAQTPAGTPSCESLLDEAQARYVDLDFEPVEALVLACVLRDDTEVADLRRGYRLLTLSFLRQELVRDARGIALRLIAADPSYEPDPVQDPPDYVALFQALQDQLRVTALPIGPSADGQRVPPPIPHLNVNRATAEALTALPGLDASLAERIVADRTENGTFERTDDLTRVEGVDDDLLGRLSPYLTTAEPQRATGGRAAQ